MTPEEKLAHDNLLKDMSAQVTSIVTEQNKPLVGQVKELNDGLAALKALADKSPSDDVRKEVERLAGVIKAMGEEAKNKEPKNKKSFATNIMDAYKGIRASDMESLKNGTTRKLILKQVGNETTANVTPSVSNAIPFTLTMNEPGITPFARRNPFMLDICNVGTCNSMYVQWAEAQGNEGGASTTAEANAKSQADFNVVEVSQKVEKITAYIKVSKEMLNDISFIDAEIRNELMSIVQLKLDTQILSGDGSTPNMKGIINFAATFAGTPFVNAVDYDNRFDVLRVARNQIMRATGGDTNYAANFIPNYVILNPDDYTAMDLTKGGSYNRGYVRPGFASEDGKVIAGMQVVENAGMTSGQFLAGDFTKANVRIREGANITMGYDEDDFTKNLVTIMCELRAVSYVKGNHSKAFSYGVFSSALSSLKNANS